MNLRHRTLLSVLRRRKRLVLYLLSFVGIVLLQTWLYKWGMARFEGRPRSFLDSFGVIVQSLTTAGYGQDAPWNSVFVSVLIIFAQFTGIAYVFIALPLFVVPYIEDIVFEPRIPDTIEEISDHVIVGGSPQFYSALIEDLQARDRPHLIVENDTDRAEELQAEEESVITGDMTTTDTLENANIDEARAVVVDETTLDGIGTTLSVRNFDEELNVTCLIDDPTQSQYLRYAGATTVLSPKHRLGKSLADKAQNVFQTELDAVEDVDEELDIAEFPVTGDSNICGLKFDEFQMLTASNVNLVGAWVRGEFVTEFTKHQRIDRNTLLVVAGTGTELDRLAERIDIRPRRPTEGRVVVAGHGIVGSTADAILQKADIETTAIDAEKRDAVDVVGDATSASTFDDANVEEASTVILCLSDDPASLKATLVASTLNPDAEIIVAANDVTNTNKLHRAGADYVLALPDVAARMTTLDLFEKDVMQLCNRVELSEVTADEFEGRNPEDGSIEHEKGVAVVGVRRDGHLVTDFDDDFEIDSEDRVVIAGPASETEKCEVGFPDPVDD
jgi:Trk K+ transport system NAD-binding subunit